ncbi:glycosyltransferase family A protein [uncultured Pseudoalteromonas sp.]|uniref:glycosyltransferase family 2 protein n=1 Tax=uncultured Pseudoalteromonas sp. TaxID=114053 RepID=UPI002594A481|nr:glycosyltransferase family A protein [uncultured Pseudoalteromonas sp.]
MSVSVIITTYNDSEFLKRAIYSVINQNFSACELIVVDDGSENNNAEKVVSDINCDKLVINFFYKENGGASSARNYGIERATGDYIAFLDADDEWLPNHLEIKLRKIKAAGPNCFGVYSGFVCKPIDVYSSFTSVNGKVSPDFIGKKNGFPGGAPSYLFKREFLADLNGFDVSLKQNEDFDLILRLIHQGFTFYGNNEATFIRYLRDDSLTRNNRYFRSYNRVNQFLLKAWEKKYLSKREVVKRFLFNSLSLIKKFTVSLVR